MHGCYQGTNAKGESQYNTLLLGHFPAERGEFSLNILGPVLWVPRERGWVVVVVLLLLPGSYVNVKQEKIRT